MTAIFSGSLNNYNLWKRIKEGYNENDKIIQIAKLYNEEQDPNSHFQKLATCIHRYMKKICREATETQLKNEQYVLAETPKQQNINQTQIINVIKKWVAEQLMTIESLLFQGNEQKYILIIIERRCAA